MDEPFPWQPTDETAFSQIASVSFGRDLRLYAAGFREGAQRLLEYVSEQGHSQDLLVYPIVHNLRHAVELLLKQVIRAARRLVEVPGDFPDSHRLKDLWTTCKPLLQRIWAADISVNKVEGILFQLSQLDPEGEAFRYPVTTKKGGERRATLPEDLRNIDLGALARDLLDVIDLLDGADTGIDVYLEEKADMLEEARQIEREMRAEYEADMRAEYQDEAWDW